MGMKIKGKIIFPHVYVLTFKTRYELCMSFVRLQEFYESPKFRGKYFTLEEFMDYWAREFGNGAFDYTALWNGFNLPGKVIEKWEYLFCSEERLIRDLIRDKEDVLIRKIWEMIESEDTEYENIYVIGVHGKGSKSRRDETIEHESAHAFYTLYPEYKKSCNELLKKVPKGKYQKALDKLTKKGYCKSVIKDELQAYYSTQQDAVYDPLNLLSSRKEFVDNFKEFKKKLTSKEK